MQNDILEMLNGEIARLVKHLGTLSPGTEDYEHVTQDLTNLYDRRAKELANENAAKELELKEKQFVYNEDKDNNDTLLKQQEIDERKKDRWTGVGLKMFTGAVELGAIGYWLNKGLEFEKTGCLTSRTFSTCVNHMFKIIFRK